MTGFRSTVLIALGGNLPFRGDPPDETLARAIARIASAGPMIRSVSRFFGTPCFPAGAGPDFVNAGISLATDLAPAALLQVLQEVELEFGRQRSQRWGMRTLDLDLIAVGQAVHPDVPTQTSWRELPVAAQIEATPEQLILPHPRLQDRPFVLVPLSDIAPDWRHPVLGRTVSQLCAALPAADVAEVRPI